MAMVKHVFEIIDDANELRQKIHKGIDIKVGKIERGEIAGWNDKSLQLLSDLAKKVDEIYERLVRLEDEVRKKGARSEAVPLYKIEKKKVKHKRKKQWYDT
jgi:hypothetical protein